MRDAPLRQGLRIVVHHRQNAGVAMVRLGIHGVEIKRLLDCSHGGDVRVHIEKRRRILVPRFRMRRIEMKHAAKIVCGAFVIANLV